MQDSTVCCICGCSFLCDWGLWNIKQLLLKHYTCNYWQLKKKTKYYIVNISTLDFNRSVVLSCNVKPRNDAACALHFTAEICHALFYVTALGIITMCWALVKMVWKSFIWIHIHQCCFILLPLLVHFIYKLNKRVHLCNPVVLTAANEVELKLSCGLLYILPVMLSVSFLF